METKRPISPNAFDAQVGALLDRVHESASIVDSLMAMPLPGKSDAPPEWDAAVTRRLERRLVDAMRSILESEEQTRESA
ncbi:hypothetical protein ABMA32_21135 [Mesorhizobium sp. VNQ89]|uniref:hypothetical protein n=1 Tax=Mesorhizobium quangtriensis TaxID=3157709 RepID=UPI0032B78DA0